MSPLNELLGDTLQSAAGTSSTEHALGGATAVGFYFSAHWCGPCRSFTPQLAEAYKKYKDLGKKFEIVFVSSDRDEAAFASYFADMPWLALPFAARDTKAKLSKKFKVSGIPTLVIVDGQTGETITTDGRSSVMEDPEGASFPWKPPSLWEALGEDVLNGEGESVSVSELRGAGKVLGLYFSAAWCPPCHAFTPKLVETYKAVKAAGKQFEIIFVSSDRSMADFQKYFREMPWLAIPHGDKRKGTLSKLFDVEGIPTFVMIDAETGATINPNARGSVSADPQGAEFPWTPPLVADLSSPDGINEETALCLMVDKCSKEVQDAALAAFTQVAEASKARASDILFFVARTSDGAVPQVRSLTNLGEKTDVPTLLMLDIPDGGGFYVSEPEKISVESVSAFLDAYAKKGNGKDALERKQLGASAGA